MQNDVLNVLTLLLLLATSLLVVPLVPKPSAFASNSVHGVPVTTLVEIFRPLLWNLSLCFEFRAGRASD
jgi:hypothetical protein